MSSPAVAAALSLPFATTGTLDSRITFTRASTGTYFNSSGTLVSAANDVARFDYNPVGLAARGLLIEEARTNLLLNSLLNGTNLGTQTVTVTATPYTISFYGTGMIVLSGAFVATINGGGAFPTRTTLTFTPTAGALICTVTGTVQYANIEVGGFATSFIPTAGATVTRASDNANMTGTNFSSWYNQSEGTFVADVTFEGGDSASKYLVGVAPSPADGYYMGIAYDKIGSAGGNDIALGALANGASAKLGWAYITSGSATSVGSKNGSAVTGTLVFVPSTITKLSFGNLSNDYALTSSLWIKSLTYYSTRKTNAEIAVLTT